jgi:hypothetical protein
VRIDAVSIHGTLLAWQIEAMIEQPCYRKISRRSKTGFKCNTAD